MNDGHQRPYTDEERAAWPYGKPPEPPMGIPSGIKSEAEIMFEAIVAKFAYVEQRIGNLEMEIRLLRERG